MEEPEDWGEEEFDDKTPAKTVQASVDDPADRHSILIVDSENNVKMGLVNENAPLAQALLGLASGDKGLLDISGQRPHQIRVIMVQRQEKLLS